MIDYDFIVANFANPDMVGHTGSLGCDDPGAVEFVDGCLARVARPPCRRRGRSLCITADHGNADEMRDANGNPMTAHSLNPVPIVLVGRVRPRPPTARRRPGRRRADAARAGWAATGRGNDRAIAACSTADRDLPLLSSRPWRTSFSLGQMLVSIALMASILLQSRGAGLGATFGGDSSVYPQPARHREAPLPVHGRPDDPVRHLLDRRLQAQRNAASEPSADQWRPC